MRSDPLALERSAHETDADDDVGTTTTTVDAAPTWSGSYPERTLDAGHLAAIRSAREALFSAAQRGDTGEIETSLARFVHAMWSADFARQTIGSLVAAAIDAGLPTARGAARRAQRAQSLTTWTRLAERIADVLAHRVTRIAARGTLMAVVFGTMLELATF